MAYIDIISGFLGAGKTTLIKKLLSQVYTGEKIVLIENEFGEINIDGGFLKDTGIEISEMSAGCICCSLVGDFGKALREVQERFAPNRILIEPSGVGKLSDVIRAVEETAQQAPQLRLHSAVTVADASKVKTYMKNFGEFYNDQIAAAGTVILSRTQKLTEEKLQDAIQALREKNAAAPILTTPWDQLSGEALLGAIERESLSQVLMDTLTPEDDRRRLGEAPDCSSCQLHLTHRCGGQAGGCNRYVEEDRCSDPDCGCHHDHAHHHHEHGHDHGHEHHHDHAHGHHCGDPNGSCHEHDDHHHCDDPNCTCHDHNHHHAGEVFSSWGRETPRRFDPQALKAALDALDGGEYGSVLRAKGIVESSQGGWLEFDYVPGEYDLRPGQADYTGRLCVIGSGLQEEKLAALFGL